MEEAERHLESTTEPAKVLAENGWRFVPIAGFPTLEEVVEMLQARMAYDKYLKNKKSSC